MAVNIYHRAPPLGRCSTRKISNKNVYARALTYNIMILYNVYNRVQRKSIKTTTNDVHQNSIFK
jgi:hypothetical protein